MDCDTTGDFDPQLAKLINYKSRGMLGRYGLGREDVEDVNQELAAQLVSALREHNPALSTRLTFASRLIQNKIATLITHTRAQKRDHRRAESMADEGQAICRHAPNADLSIDVANAIASLPAGLRTIAELFKTLPESEVARSTGKTRQQIRTAKAQIADHFRKQGLAEHLDFPNQLERRLSK